MVRMTRCTHMRSSLSSWKTKKNSSSGKGVVARSTWINAHQTTHHTWFCRISFCLTFERIFKKTASMNFLGLSFAKIPEMILLMLQNGRVGTSWGLGNCVFHISVDVIYQLGCFGNLGRCIYVQFTTGCGLQNLPLFVGMEGFPNISSPIKNVAERRDFTEVMGCITKYPCKSFTTGKWMLAIVNSIPSTITSWQNWNFNPNEMVF